MSKETAVVICPGRGTYNATELGYLKRYHKNKKAFLASIDGIRERVQQIPVTQLDAERKFRPQLHTSSENASALIYACALADFADIDRERFDVVAITGNSMGWYLALAAADVLPDDGGISLVNTMGNIMQHQGVGGQIIYPLVNEQWQPDTTLREQLNRTLLELSQDPENEIYTSIELGGLRVLAANERGIEQLMQKLPPYPPHPPQQNRYPMRLPNHAAFHSPLLNHVSALAMAKTTSAAFQQPRIPLIDGRGHIWQPHATSVDDLYHYTLQDQVHRSYDFASAVRVSVKEFAPDRLIILGPGSTLGPPVAQELIRLKWHNLTSKADFSLLQKKAPFVLAMGIETQRQQVVRSKS